jgi:hypothetical protein
VIPFRVLIDLAARFTPQPPPRGDRGDHRSPADPDATPTSSLVSLAAQRLSEALCRSVYADAKLTDEDVHREACVLDRLAALSRGLRPLAAAQSLFARELRKDHHV